LLSANLYDIELGYVNAMYLGVRENLAFSWTKRNLYLSVMTRGVEPLWYKSLFFSRKCYFCFKAMDLGINV
jgi:hypothetical protein